MCVYNTIINLLNSTLNTFDLRNQIAAIYNNWHGTAAKVFNSSDLNFLKADLAELKDETDLENGLESLLDLFFLF